VATLRHAGGIPPLQPVGGLSAMTAGGEGVGLMDFQEFLYNRLAWFRCFSLDHVVRKSSIQLTYSTSGKHLRYMWDSRGERVPRINYSKNSAKLR